jgi:hypothetical protein
MNTLFIDSSFVVIFIQPSGNTSAWLGIVSWRGKCWPKRPSGIEDKSKLHKYHKSLAGTRQDNKQDPAG